MKNLMQTVCAFVITIACFSNIQAQSVSTININNTMPNRISMNVTIGKQNMMVSIIDGGCVISIPPHKAYKVNSATNTMVEVSQGEYSEMIQRGKQTTAQGAGDKNSASLNQGAQLISGAAGMMGNVTGMSIVSAAISGVASAASAATSGRTAHWDLKTNQTRLELPDNLPDGDYELTFVIAEKATSGLKDTLKTQVRLGFSLTQGVLKTKHDTAKNSISNIR